MTAATDDLAGVLRGGPVSYAYLAVPVDTGAGAIAQARRRSVLEALEDAGSPAADREAVVAELESPTGLGSPSSRYLIARDGAVVLSEAFPSAPSEPDLIGFAPVPDLVPLLRHRADDVAYLVVEAGREGGSIRLCRAQRARPQAQVDVQGRTDAISKFGGGGWSHLNWQEHTEELWRQTEAQLAERVDELVRQTRPEFILLAGDVRADQLLRDQLASASRGLVRTVASHTRAAGSSDAAIERELESALAEHERAEREAASNRLASNDHDRAALGVGEVVAALQQAQVDTLLLAPRRLETLTLVALDPEPWIATEEDAAAAASANVLGSVSARAALVRAAVLTDASIVFDDEDDPVNESGVAAVLRWPAAPGG